MSPSLNQSALDFYLQLIMPSGLFVPILYQLPPFKDCLLKDKALSSYLSNKDKALFCKLNKTTYFIQQQPFLVFNTTKLHLITFSQILLQGVLIQNEGIHSSCGTATTASIVFTKFFGFQPIVLKFKVPFTYSYIITIKWDIREKPQIDISFGLVYIGESIFFGG